MDCRWDVVSGSVDDRTEEERGLKVTTQLFLGLFSSVDMLRSL